VEYYRASCRILAPSMFHSHSAKSGVGVVTCYGRRQLGSLKFMCDTYTCIFHKHIRKVACNFQSGVVLNSQTRKIRIHLAQFDSMLRMHMHICTPCTMAHGTWHMLLLCPYGHVAVAWCAFLIKLAFDDRHGPVSPSPHSTVDFRLLHIAA
jgi:hypothetical protein